MSKSSFSKRLRFWVRSTLFVGLLVVGFYLVNDPATPKLYKLLIAFGLLGFILYFFLGGGGSKDDGFKNKEDSEYEDMSIPRRQLSRPPESSEHIDYED